MGNAVKNDNILVYLIFLKKREVKLLWSTGNVALDQHLMPTMNKKFSDTDCWP